MERYFVAIDVWKRRKGRLCRYRCFQILPESKFCVQSRDFYSLPVDPSECRRHDENFLELLSEEDPSSRGGLFDSLEEAIRQHEEDFADLLAELESEEGLVS